MTNPDTISISEEGIRQEGTTEHVHQAQVRLNKVSRSALLNRSIVGLPWGQV
jgi:hypothetical protein